METPTRRIDDCNCGALREISAELRGEIALIVRDIKDMRTHFEEAHLTVKECVVELQAGSTALRLGESRFETLEDDLNAHSSGKGGQHADLDKKIKFLSIGVLFSLGTLMITGHGKALINLIKDIL